MATPPPATAVPYSTTVRGVDDGSWSRMAKVICTSPWVVVFVLVWEPVTSMVNGGEGTTPRPPVGVVVGVVDGADVLGTEVATPAFLRASWARSEVDVPARRDQPGRSGPTAAKMTMTTTTMAVAKAAPVRWPTVKVRPVTSRQSTTT